MSLHTTAPAALPTPTTPGGPVPGDAGPGGWRALGAVLTALLLILGTTGVASWLVRKTEAVDRTYQRTVSRVVVDSGSGDVTVAAGADGEIRLHERRFWSWSKPVDQVAWEGARCGCRSAARRSAWARAVVSTTGCGYRPGCRSRCVPARAT